MVIHFFNSLILNPIFLLLFLLLLSNSSNALAANDSLLLSQKEVTKLVMSQSHRARETNLKYEQMKLTPLQKKVLYDWTLSAESGYDFDHTEGPTHPATLTSQTYKSSLKLKKSLITGTLLNVEFTRNSLYSNDVNTASPKITQYTYDLLGLSFEQNLWKNSFGKQDRAELLAAEQSYLASSMSKALDLQDLVLESLRLYWNTYIAQENFNEALSARDRYQRFVSELRRKTAYGYSNSYELYQVQAELESREQQIKTSSLEFIKNMDLLTQLLNLDPSTKIQFPKIDTVPEPPSLIKKNISENRNIQSQSIKVKAAESYLVASQSQSNPILSFNGSLYGSGFNEKSTLSENRLISGSNPKYYLGFKFVYQFGSDYGNQDQINKKVTLELEQHKYQRLSEELKNNLSNAERKVQTTFSAVTSIKKQNDLREKTLNEMQRNFNNGRVDLNLLIDAMNKFFSARVQYIRSVGDYFIALNEWAALNDELVVNSEEDLSL